MGLLGDQTISGGVLDDMVAQTELGLGASPRAIHLVKLGLVCELLSKLERKLGGMKRRKGAPKKPISIDRMRAFAVLDAGKFAKEKFEKRQFSQLDGIDLARQIEKIICSVKPGKKLFDDMTSQPTIQNSVSKGLIELGCDFAEFMKK